MATWLKILVFSSATLVLGACGGDSGLPPLRYDVQPKNIYAYRASVPIASTALRCAKAERASESCTIATLAPVAYTHPTPTIDNIMDRVLVSHDWMGKRFEQMLTRMPADIVHLLGGVTAIVISDHIRPSYYTDLTGAIYLDPEHLWLTQEEREDISTAPDYRAAFAREMAFASQWRYVIPGQMNDHSGTNRTLDEIEPELAALLFHELAHANDIFPRSQYGNVNVNQSFLSVSTAIKQKGDNAATLAQSYLSSILSTEQRLTSDNMKRIAAILYAGDTPSEGERRVTAAEVGEDLAGDGANDDYSYTSQYEDLAMLFEEAMMKLHYSADRDIAFLNLPDPSIENPRCDHYTVGWGMRNRLGDGLVQPRAQWVVEQLLPHRDYSLLFDSLESPTPLPVGAGWCSSETFNSPSALLFHKSVRPAVRHTPFDPTHSLRRSELRLH